MPNPSFPSARRPAAAVLALSLLLGGPSLAQAPAGSEADAARWGALATMAGKPWLSQVPGELATVWRLASWVEPGVSMRFQRGFCVATACQATDYLVRYDDKARQLEFLDNGAVAYTGHVEADAGLRMKGTGLLGVLTAETLRMDAGSGLLMANAHQLRPASAQELASATRGFAAVVAALAQLPASSPVATAAPTADAQLRAELEAMKARVEQLSQQLAQQAAPPPAPTPTPTPTAAPAPSRPPSAAELRAKAAEDKRQAQEKARQEAQAKAAEAQRLAAERQAQAQEEKRQLAQAQAEQARRLAEERRAQEEAARQLAQDQQRARQEAQRRAAESARAAQAEAARAEAARTEAARTEAARAEAAQRQAAATPPAVAVAQPAPASAPPPVAQGPVRTGMYTSGTGYEVDVKVVGDTLVLTELAHNRRSEYRPTAPGSRVYGYRNPNTGTHFALTVQDNSTLVASRFGSSGEVLPNGTPLRFAGGSTSPQPPASPAVFAAMNERGQHYLRMAQTDPTNAQAWSFCGMAAMAQAYGQNDTQVRQAAAALKSIATTNRSPCSEVITQKLWDSLP